MNPHYRPLGGLDQGCDLAGPHVHAAAEAEHHFHEMEDSFGGDCWSKKVPTRPPPAAAVGRYDTSGDHAEAELAAFRKAHERRMQAAYKPDELRQARFWIERGLKQHRIKHADAGGRRGVTG